MNYYPHHIGDFDRATRHLTRLERSIYRDMMDVYYDTEQVLTLDQPALCRKIVARTEDERAAVVAVLAEFFVETPTGWYHARCEEEIETYRKNNSQKSLAGKASAAARAKKLQEAINGISTAVAAAGQRPLNGTPTNQEPITNNQKPEPENPLSSLWPDGAVEVPPGKAKKGKFTGTADDFVAARWMFDMVRKVNPTAKDPNYDMWANDVRLMREIDGRTSKEICALFLWAKKDSFWCANIQSPAKLRKQWDTLSERRGQVPASNVTQFPVAKSVAEQNAANTAAAKRLLFGNKLKNDDDQGVLENA